MPVKNIINKIGEVIKGIGYIVFFIFSLWGLLICFQLIKYVFGEQYALISLLIFPLTLFFTPWYVLYESGNWFPLLIIYGGWLVGRVLVNIGEWMATPRVLTIEEIDKIMMEAPPGESQFRVGDRIIDPLEHRGAVVDIVEKDGKMKIGVIFENLFLNETLKNHVVYINPIEQKIKMIK